TKKLGHTPRDRSLRESPYVESLAGVPMSLRLSPFLFVLPLVLPFSGLAQEDFQLTPEQEDRLLRYLPRSYPKLDRRLPVHVVAIGDSITRNLRHDELMNSSHHAYHGVFLRELAKTFFYPGGVRDIRPWRELPQKINRMRGLEITMENLGMNGRIALHALSRLTADAFLNDPDLVLINFGVNEAVRGVSVDTYRKALRLAVQSCKARNTDVILLGPSIIHLDQNGQSLFGATRPYAAVMRDVAVENGVLFVDLGKVTARVAGLPIGSTAEEIEQKLDLEEGIMFDHPGMELIKDDLHPGEQGHLIMGRAIMDQLLDGAPTPRYRLTGHVVLDDAGHLTLHGKVKDLTGEGGKCVVLFREWGGWIPDNPLTELELRPGKGEEFQVHLTGKEKVYRLSGGEPYFRFPAIISDPVEIQIYDLQAPIIPVAPVWELGLIGGHEGFRDAFEVKGQLVNMNIEPATGSWEAIWNEQSVRGDFSLEAGESKPLVARFSLPFRPGTIRASSPLQFKVTTGGRTIEFVRDIEATRNIAAAGQAVPLSRGDLRAIPTEGSSVSLQTLADRDGIYFVFNGEEIDAAISQVNPAVSVEVFVDARPFAVPDAPPELVNPGRRTFGFVDYIRIGLWRDNDEIKIDSIRPAVFGHGYNLGLDRSAIQASREFGDDGTSRIVVGFPRSFFYRHEWALGNPNSLMGIQTHIRFLQKNDAFPDGFFPETTHFMLSTNRIEPFNAESLSVLELAPEPSGRWSVRFW
ncbi:MAG: GDSL-type esterase/lipase family protein, partial [Verrucomicrobiota bacterium]